MSRFSKSLSSFATVSRSLDVEALVTDDRGDDFGASKGRVELDHRLKTKRRAIGTLDHETREYMHVNDYGKPLPTWMEFKKQKKTTRYNYLMAKLHQLMTDGTSSSLAMFVSNFMVFSISLSVISFCLETLPSLQEDRNATAASVFWWIEAVTIQIFAVDYLLRFVSASDNFKFVIEPFNIIDLIAIVPWYGVTWTSTTFNGTTVFRVVRLFRVFRVLKLGGRYSKLLLVFGALRKSLDMLILMVFFISLCIVFFATLMYYAERGTWQEALGYYVRPNEPGQFDNGDPKPSPYESIVSSFWWAIVTLSTVGYGDTFPITAGGKAVACVAMIVGVLTLALPISVIGTTFSNDWAAHNQEEEARQKQKGHKATTSTTSPHILRLQRLVESHLNNMLDLVALNGASETAYDNTSGALNHSLQLIKKQLATEAEADKRLRRLAHQGKSAGSLGSFMSSVTGEPMAPIYTNPLREDEEGEGGQPLDRHYLYLSEETIRQRYGTEDNVGEVQGEVDTLTERAAHVRRMAVVDERVRDAGLVGLVRQLVHKHMDLTFMLQKEQERQSTLDELKHGMKKLRRELHLMQQQVGLQQQQQQQPGGGEATTVPAGLETGQDGSKAALAVLQMASASQASRGTDQS